MLQINGIDTLLEVINDQQEAINTLDSSGVEVGHLNVSEKEAEVSKALEYRWQGAGPEVWKQTNHPPSDYVTWAFALRTAKELEDDLPEKVNEWIDDGLMGDELWERIGEYASRKFENTMRRVIYPPNTDLTEERKGFDNPLVADGAKPSYSEDVDLLNSISYELTEGGEEPEQSATERWEAAA